MKSDNFYSLFGTVCNSLDKHAPVFTIFAIEDVTHRLGHAAPPVNVELVESLVHCVGETNNARQVVITATPVEGGEVDASEPVDGLG